MEPVSITQWPRGHGKFFQNTMMMLSVLGMVRNSLITRLLTNSQEEPNIQGLPCWIASCSLVSQPFTPPGTKLQDTAGYNPKPFMDFLSSPSLFSQGSCHLHILLHRHSITKFCSSVCLNYIFWLRDERMDWGRQSQEEKLRSYWRCPSWT